MSKYPLVVLLLIELYNAMERLTKINNDIVKNPSKFT